MIYVFLGLGVLLVSALIVWAGFRWESHLKRVTPIELDTEPLFVFDDDAPVEKDVWVTWLGWRGEWFVWNRVITIKGVKYRAYKFGPIYVQIDL